VLNKDIIKNAFMKPESVSQRNQLRNQLIPRRVALLWKSRLTSTIQKKARILCKNQIRYHVHKITALVHILRNINIVNALASYLFQIHFNNTLPSTPRSYKLSLSMRFPT
jgi:hypothetical protein